jgi:hypothetical protein
MGLAEDLAAEDEAGLAAGAHLVQGRVVLGLHLHAQPADVGGHLEQVAGAEQVMVPGARVRAGSPQSHRGSTGPVQVALDLVDHSLGRGQVAGGQEHEQPVGSRLEDVQLPVRRDVVDTGVGPGVGRHHQAVLQPEPDAIGHDPGASAEKTLQARGHRAHR